MGRDGTCVLESLTGTTVTPGTTEPLAGLVGDMPLPARPALLARWWDDAAPGADWARAEVAAAGDALALAVWVAVVGWGEAGVKLSLLRSGSSRLLRLRGLEAPGFAEGEVGFSESGEETPCAG
jgi:hypothetical protein